MSAGTDVGTARHRAPLPWGHILLSAIAAVSWALTGMAATAALGLHLLQADSAGSLGPMTAAVVALGAGGSVSPAGDVSAFGLKGAEAHTAVEITPLGVSLVGALLLSWFFLRSLRAAGVVIAPAELLARAGSVAVLFTAVLGGLAWAGHDVVTIDGGSLGLDKLPGGGDTGGGLSLPGLGDVSGLLPDRIGDLIDAKAAVGFTVDTSATLLGGLGWCAGVLLIALLAARRAPLPPGWAVVHRVVRPAVSALVTVLLVAVAAGLAAGAYAAIGDDHPRRIAGAALLGAPNGVWLGVPLGLFVPWDGRATGLLGTVLPHPLDQLLAGRSDQPVTVGRLAGLDGRVWLLAVAAVLMILLAGVLTAARTPVLRYADTVLGFTGRCALRLGVATALALPLLAWLTDVSVDAGLSVLGFDAFGAGIELHGRLGMALLLGAAWGAGAGAVGALLAWTSGAAGTRAARAAVVAAAAVAAAAVAAGPGGAGPAGVRGVGRGDAASEAWVSRAEAGGFGYDEYGHSAGRGGDGAAGQGAAGQGGGGAAGLVGRGAGAGPYVPGSPYRPPNPDTNPYLRTPEEPRDIWPPAAGQDVYGAPTIAGSLGPPPPPRRRPSPRPGEREPRTSDDGPPPPPPPPGEPGRRG
ncbi:streptophobe family protein [Streptomyces sp. SP2-10]|uniref:streptophobe family protein n=1 Tax=Streptomyces sp. SP2-10 TaxID=2873385 RepID=UPI001CA797C1|nr:streptophobe family protein [Streptomyces sp. SP2-10]MBY8846426.1 streptophobe family protein [Streptomyces sp. SP2-10]